MVSDRFVIVRCSLEIMSKNFLYKKIIKLVLHEAKLTQKPTNAKKSRRTYQIHKVFQVKSKLIEISKLALSICAHDMCYYILVTECTIRTLHELLYSPRIG